MFPFDIDLFVLHMGCLLNPIFFDFDFFAWQRSIETKEWNTFLIHCETNQYQSDT